MTAQDFKYTAQVLAQFGQALVDNYRAELAACNYQTGQLYKTMNYSVSDGTNSWVISIHLEEYWRYIENGRRPGAKMPPLNVIENWIKVRNILPHPMTLKSGKTVIPTIKQLSFLIARSISQKGIPARPLFKKSFDSAVQSFLDKIKQAIQQDITEYLQGA